MLENDIIPKIAKPKKKKKISEFKKARSLLSSVCGDSMSSDNDRISEG